MIKALTRATEIEFSSSSSSSSGGGGGGGDGGDGGGGGGGGSCSTDRVVVRSSAFEMQDNSVHLFSWDSTRFEFLMTPM